MVGNRIVTTIELRDKFSGALLETSSKLQKFNKHTTTTINNFTKKGREVVRITKTVNSKLKNQQAAIRKLGQRHEGFFKVLGMGQEDWQRFNKEGGEFTKRSSRAANSIRGFTLGLRRFRMEMLSVMFFGMGMQRFFTGLLKPALQVTGIFELWSSVLQVLFLPIALALLDLLMPLFNWLMNLDEATKLLIGKFVLFGIGLGLFLFLLGTITLGLGGIILVFGGLFNIIDKLIPDINVMGVNMSSFIEAGLAIGIVKSLWEGFKNIIGSLMEKFMGLSFVKEAMEKLGITVGENQTAWETFKQIVSAVWDKIKEKIGLTGTALGEKGLIGSIKEMFPSFDEIKKKAQEFIKEFKIDELTESLNKLGTELGNLVPSLNTIASVLRPIATLIGAIGTGVDLIRGSSPFSPDIHSILSKSNPEFFSSKAAPNLNTTNNLNINASSNVDIDQILTQVNNATNEQFSRLSRG